MSKFLILFILFSINLHAQNCKELNSFDSFHGIKLGLPMPKVSKKYFKKSGHFYFLQRLNLEDSKDYSSFGDFFFTEVSTSVINDSIVYGIGMWNKLSETDSTQIANNQSIDTYNNLYAQIKNLFGDYTRIAREDDPILPTVGKKYEMIWECTKVKIVLTLTYAAAASDLNTIGIDIIDVPLEKQEKLKEISQ
jgi:hypothetical protein